jgi:hypothetical protein
VCLLPTCRATAMPSSIVRFICQGEIRDEKLNICSVSSIFVCGCETRPVLWNQNAYRYLSPRRI